MPAIRKRPIVRKCKEIVVTDDEAKIISIINNIKESSSDTEAERYFKSVMAYMKPSVALLSRQIKIPGLDADEVSQECWFALRYKVVEDFNPKRGRFKSFAVLCIRRHLFSLIKGGNQQKRRVLNESLSLDENRADGNDDLSLTNIVADKSMPVDYNLIQEETYKIAHARLMSKLSPLEKEVFKLRMQALHYHEIVDALKRIFPSKDVNKKVIDNALQRFRLKCLTHKHLLADI